MIKNIIVILLLFAFILSGCGATETEVVYTSTAEPPVQPPVQPTAEPTAEPIDDSLKRSILTILDDGLSALGTNEYHADVDCFFFVPTEESIKADTQLLVGGNLMALRDWTEMTASFMELSTIIYELSGSSFGVLSPFNSDNVLLFISNDVVVYDFADDYR